MNSSDRVKLLRRTLGLSQEQFGQKLGITKASVSRIESGVHGLSDRMAKSMHNTFKVDYFWLTEGKGEMLLEFSDAALDQIIEDYNLDEYDRLLIQTYIESNDDDRKAIKTFLQTFAKKIETQKKDEKN